VKTNQAVHAVATMCRVLGVSTSGYYAWRERKESTHRKTDGVLRKQVEVIFWWSRGTYGAPLIHQQLKARGTSTGKKRVARLMRSSGLQGATRRKWTTTTVRDQAARPAPDLVNRNFVATGPNQLWVADITFIPTIGQTARRGVPPRMSVRAWHRAHDRSPFRARCRRRDAARVGGDPFVMPLQVAGSLFCDRASHSRNFTARS
jgi:hypothetical protein